VHREHSVPVVAGQLPQDPVTQDPGIVHQHVDPSGLRDDVLDAAGNLL